MKIEHIANNSKSCRDGLQLQDVMQVLTVPQALIKRIFQMS